MLKKVKLLKYFFLLLPITNITNILAIDSHVVNSSFTKSSKINKRQTTSTPKPDRKLHIGGISDNTHDGILNTLLNQEHHTIFQNANLVITSITTAGALVSVNDEWYEIEFNSQQVTYSSILRTLLIKGITLDLGAVTLNVDDEFLIRLFELYRLNIDENLDYTQCVNDIKTILSDLTHVSFITPEGEVFSANFTAEQFNLERYNGIKTNLGLIENNYVKTIIDAFYKLNKDFKPNKIYKKRFKIMHKINEHGTGKQMCQLRIQDWNYNVVNNNLQEPQLIINEEKYYYIFLYYEVISDETNADSYTAIKNDQNKRFNDDDDNCDGGVNKESKTNNDLSKTAINPDTNKASFFDQPGTSYNTNNYNLGTIKDNEKNTIIQAFINQMETKTKPTMADFNFITVTPKAAKIGTTTTLNFIYQTKAVTLMKGTIFNLNFNTEHVTLSSIIRAFMPEKMNYTIPILFLWSSSDLNNKECMKNYISQQFFTYMNWIWTKDKMLLPSSLININNKQQIINNSTNIIVENLIAQECDLKYITLKITDEKEKIIIPFRVFNVRNYLI